MIRFLCFPFLTVSGCTVPYSLECSEQNSYVLSVDTAVDPVAFSWDGSAARDLTVTAADDSVLWEIGFDSYAAARESDDTSILNSPVSYGDVYKELENFIERTAATDLVSGETYTLNVYWGCMTSEGEYNNEAEKTVEFTMP